MHQVSKLSKPNRKSLVVFSFLVFMIAGCGDGRPTRVPVSGQVLIDGKPLSRGRIFFASAVGRPSQGRLDQEGRFRLSCYEENDGALLGTHRVTIIAAEPLSPTKTRWLAPKKLTDERTSGLTQEITGPTENLMINISWDGGHEFVEVEEAAGGELMPAGRKEREKDE
jgi:hypothetical protein